MTIHDATPMMADGMTHLPVIDVLRKAYRVEHTFADGLREPVLLDDIIPAYGKDYRVPMLREAQAVGLTHHVGVWNSNKVFMINSEGTRGACIE